MKCEKELTEISMVRHDFDNGRIESSSSRAHTRFKLDRKFIQCYNYERLHIALNHSTPAKVLGVCHMS
jgi:transposase InsO family protein